MTRYVPESEQYIIDVLAWMGISPNEGYGIGGDKGPYRQSERLALYKEHALKLVESGHAYYAFDTEEELDGLRKSFEGTKKKFAYNCFSRDRLKNSLSMSEEELKSAFDSGVSYVIRFKMSKGVDVSFSDSVRDSVSFNTNNLQDEVLIKADGFPAYHIANVVDDHFMEITHVIRGVEWLSSTPLHVLIYDALGWDKPTFCHLPLVNGPDGKKLSKREVANYKFPIFPLGVDTKDENGVDIHYEGLNEYGFDPLPLLNALSLTGWNPGGEKEHFTKEELVDLFTLERINNASAMFDIKKATSFNAAYIRSLDNLELFNNYIAPEVEFFPYKYDDEKNVAIAIAAKERANFGKELVSNIIYFFGDVVFTSALTIKFPEEFSSVMNVFLTKDIEWNEKTIHNELEATAHGLDTQMKYIGPDLRKALTGGMPGPTNAYIMWVLGKENSFQRINALLNLIKEGSYNKNPLLY